MYYNISFDDQKGLIKDDHWSIFRVKRFFCNVVIYYPEGPKET